MKPSLVFTGRERGREGEREGGYVARRDGGRREKGTIMLVINWLPFIKHIIITHM